MRRLLLVLFLGAFGNADSAPSQQEDIRRWEEEHKQRPWDARVMCNLGVAHSKAGNDVVAIAWFRAYLAVDPAAPNAAAIRESIDKLKSRAHDRIVTLWANVPGLWLGLVEAKRVEVLTKMIWAKVADEYLEVENFDEAAKTVEREKLEPLDYSRTIQILASGGKFDKAQQICKRQKGDEDSMRAVYCRYLIDRGRFDDAKATADGIVDARARAAVVESIAVQTAKSRLDRGDLTGAEDIAATVSDTRFASMVFDRRLSKGDVSEAMRTASRLLNRRPPDYARALSKIAITQLATGDTAAAKETARKILSLGDSAIVVGDNPPKHWENEGMLVGHAVTGNIEEARRLARERLRPQWQPFAVEEGFGRIATVQTLMGDLKGAEATAVQSSLETATWEPGYVQAGIASALLSQGKIGAAKAWARKTERWLRADLFAAIAAAQIRSGDLIGGEQTLMEFSLRDDREDWAFGRKGDPHAVLPGLWVGGMLLLAEMHERQGTKAEALRILNMTADIALDLELVDGSFIPEALQSLARAQAYVGDFDSAAKTQTRVIPRSATSWAGLAIDLSKRETATSLEAVLRRIGEEKELGRRLLALDELGTDLKSDLDSLRDLERRIDSQGVENPSREQFEPKSGSDFLKRSIVRRIRGDSRGALEDLSAALDRDPSLSLAAAFHVSQTIESSLARLGIVVDSAAEVGPRISKVVPGSAAESAGLKEFDRIKGLEALARAAPGEKKTLRLQRQGKELEVNLAFPAVARDPREVRTHLFRGRGYADQGKPDPAIREFAAVLLLDPKIAEAYVLRGRAKMEKKDVTGALEDYSRATELKPGDADAWLQRGKVRHRQLGEYERAEEDYTRSIALNPESADGYLGRGDARHLRGDYEGAVQDYLKTIEFSVADLKTQDNAHLRLGIVRYDQGRWADSISELGKIRKPFFMRVAQPYAWLAKCRQTNSEDATRALKEFTSRNKLDAPTEAIMKFLCGEITESDVSKAIPAMPPALHSAGYFFIGSKKLIDGDESGAKRWFARSVELKNHAYYGFASAVNALRRLK
jgi:tetratricopeptide (TPR) repeat protein